MNTILPATRKDGEDMDVDIEVPSDDVQRQSEAQVARAEAQAAAFSSDPSKIGEAEVQEFWKLQQEINHIRASLPSYRASCKILGIDPKNKEPYVSKLPIHPWQVIGAAWITEMLRSRLRACIVADDMRLGKTNTVLSHIFLDPDLVVQLKYRPTLVVFPIAAIASWLGELKRYFPTIKYKLFLGSGQKNDIVDRTHTLGTQPDDLIKFCEGLPDNDPDTARTLILTTYGTWHMRTLTVGKRNTGAPNDEEEDYEEEDRVVQAKEAKTIKSLCKGLFGTVYATRPMPLNRIIQPPFSLFSDSRLGALS